MIDAYYVPIKKIKTIEWKGDAKAFDLELYNLGQGYDEFIIANPDFEGFQFYKNIKSLPFIKSDRCIVWKYNGIWIAKHFTKNWIIEQKYFEVDLELEWEYNPDVDINIKFNTPDINDLYDLIPKIAEGRYVNEINNKLNDLKKYLLEHKKDVFIKRLISEYDLDKSKQKKNLEKGMNHKKNEGESIVVLKKLIDDYMDDALRENTSYFIDPIFPTRNI